MRIVVANDHGAVALKKELAAWLKAQGHEVVNLGVDVEDRVDYPDMAVAACTEYLKGGYDFGILLCGTGIGVTIAANKIEGIRCALVHDVFTATMAREHNDANFLAMGGRVEYVTPPTEILAAYMRAKFQGGRHAERVAKLVELDRQAK
jgi:sugar-phosphate isomerases, RpiB/LacA/LacB family